MSKAKTRRFELRTDETTDQLISEAAELLHVSKTAFVTDAARQAAERVVARRGHHPHGPGDFRRHDGVSRRGRRVVRTGDAVQASTAYSSMTQPSYSIMKLAPGNLVPAWSTSATDVSR